MGYIPKKVAKSKPQKKFRKPNAIFDQLSQIHRDADAADDALRVSIDAKATVKVWSVFTRWQKSTADPGLRSRLPARGDLLRHPWAYCCRAWMKSSSMASCPKSPVITLVDCSTLSGGSRCMSALPTSPPWSSILTMDPKIIVVAPEIMQRMVDLLTSIAYGFSLAYYPPYHSKYNPIERCWGFLENHWNGALLDS